MINNEIVFTNTKVVVGDSLILKSNIQVKGNTTIKTTSCISVEEASSEIIIDVSERALENNVVLEYTCLSAPELSVSLVGTTNGCTPSYSITSTQLLLNMDSCNDDNSLNEANESDTLVIMIVTIVAVVIVSIVVVVLVYSAMQQFKNKSPNIKRKKKTDIDMMRLKQMHVDTAIQNTEEALSRINNMLDEPQQ